MKIHLLSPLIVAAAVGACSRHQAAEAPAPAPAPAATVSAAPAPAPPPMSRADSVRADIARDGARTAPATGAWGVNASDSTALARRLRFGYDRAELTDDEIAKLEAKRDVLARHPQLRIRIAGNADERGADEYNLALGLRRAAAAKRWLIFHGVAEDRISIVSYGEEDPLVDGHDETAWERNRRDDFLVIVMPPK